nr:fibronectin type III domain-containing protein [Bacteroidales bacterium]
MRRILITTIMLLATVMPLATKGNTLMVCQSGSTTTFMPFYGYYTNMTTRSEFVYPARLLEAMNGGTITSLRFQAQSNFSWTGTFEVKLEVVDDTVFDGAFISSSKAQTVYTGTLEVVDVQGTYYTYHAMTINFDSAFQYNGGNLLVSIGCVTTGNRASQTFRFYAQPMAHVCGVWWTGATTGGMTNAQFLPQCEFTYTLNNSGCKGPKSLALSNVTNDEGTLSWTPRGTENSWEMLLDGVAVDTVGTTQYTYTGLTPMTHYTVGVRALCGTSGSEVRSIPLHTDCDTVRHSQLPLVQGFEQMTPSSSKFLERDCWRGLYFNNSNYARILSSTVHTGHNSIALYPSYDTYPNYLILPPIDMVQDLKLTYWVYGQYNTIQVGVMTDPTDSSTFVPMDVVSLPGASWTQQEVLFNSYMDGGHHIAFRVTGSGYCYVDDIMVEAIDCFHPMAVTTSTLTPTSVMVHVDDFTGANSYRIWWSDGTTTDSLYSNYSSVTINNLTSNTHYTISAATVCNDGTVTSSVSTSITTPCQGFTHNDLPVHEKFDSYAVTSSTWDGSANCWTIHNYSNYNFPRITTTHYDPAGGAGHGLSFKTRDMSQPQFAVMPRMDSLSDLNVQFWAQGDASAVLTVGVMSDPTDTTTFVALERIVPATTWTSYDIYLGSDTSGGNFIAFRAGGYATSGSNLHIDEIEISLADSCQHPTMLNITRLTQDSVSVVVDDPMHRGAYRLQVSDGSSTLTANIVGNSHSFGGLTAGTSYTVSAATLCNSVVTSESFSRIFTTPCTAVATPWSDGFENYTVFGMPPCYGHLGSGQANRMMGSPYAGSYSITLGNGGGENVLLLPAMDTVSGQMLRFYTKPGSVNNASNGKLEVGYVTNSGDASSFVALGSLAYNDSRFASGDYVDFEIVYPDNLEPGTRMAFRNREQFWNGSWRLDELSVLPAPACMRPDSVRVPDSLITWSDVTVMIYDPQELNSYRLWWTNQSTGETDST